MTDKEVKCEPASYSCRACQSGTDDTIRQLKEENDRLRDALDTIVGLYEINGGFWAVAERMHDTARAALKE